MAKKDRILAEIIQVANALPAYNPDTDITVAELAATMEICKERSRSIIQKYAAENPDKCCWIEVRGKKGAMKVLRVTQPGLTREDITGNI